MIELFDCNLRLGMRAEHSPGEPTTVPELLAELDRLSVAGALVRHRLAVETHPADANRRIFDELKDAENLVPTWSLLPEATGETGKPDETVDEMIALGVRAAWLYPKTHGYSPRDWCAGSLLSALEDRRVPVFIPWDEIDPDELAELLAGHPTLEFVLANATYRLNRVLYPLFEKHAKLHVDLGAPNASTGFVEEVTRRWGVERMLFGSGFPDHEIGPAITQLTYADITDDEKSAIGAGNLRALLEGVMT